MRFLVVMDPLTRIQVATDSTYLIMRESTERGYTTHWCTPDGLYLHNGRTHARCEPVTTGHQPPYFQTGPAVHVDTEQFDVVWMRKDPPFDMAYILATYLLDRVPDSTLVVNHPHGLKLFNEKLWAMDFPSIHPETLMTSDMARIQAFVRAQPDRVVLKPWDGNGGRGVLVTQASDRNLGSMIELLTDQGRRAVIVQPYLAGADVGDKRIVLVDGEPVAAMLRVPGQGDYRANMHVGASVQACDLSPADQHICETIGPHLKKWGQVFVGIDVIDGHLTEINITSPTGLQELNRLYGLNLQRDVIDKVVNDCLVRHREHT